MYNLISLLFCVVVYNSFLVSFWLINHCLPSCLAMLLYLYLYRVTVIDHQIVLDAEPSTLR